MPYKDKNEQKEYNKKHYQKNKTEILSEKKIYYVENCEKIKEYRQQNKSHIAEVRKKYKIKNKTKIDEYRKQNKIQINIQKNNYVKTKYKNDPIFRLSHNISADIRRSLKKHNLSKNKRHWECIVGYTSQNLKEHLENLFELGMTWGNHGEWHIDHIIPKSFFEYKSTTDVEFKYCWSLNNLQPLWAEDNLKKNNKIYH